jgi:hypothetical protein
MEQRAKFTDALAYLLLYIINQGGRPVLGDVFRRTPEQKRIFSLGLSRENGETVASAHHEGLAADIEFLWPKSTKLAQRLLAWEQYHDFWVSLGGLPMDKARPEHFEYPEKGGD